jgi:DNA-binding response OmpR family regulator
MPTKKPRILLAEDDKFICKAYKDGLSKAGFEMVIAHDGNEAMEKIKLDKPDLVLLDLIMPDKGGFEVLEELKMDNTFKKMPVVILSNLGQDSDIKQGKDLGAVDYLVKSNLSMKQVIEKVKLHLAKSR